MRVRSIVGAAVAAGFCGFVVHASAANQCPASALGACARLHLELMRPRSIAPVAPIALVARPMRALPDRG